MAKLTKKQKEALAKFDKNQFYSLEEAVDIVKNITYTKFDASVDIDVRLGVDPRKANQMVRGSLDEYIAKIKGGWTDVDVIITMPNVMPKVGALGRILGPRGLMPNPKTGTVTMEVGKAVQEAKAGKIDFKVDKFGIIHTAVAKVSFDSNKIVDNAREVLQAIIKLKPAAAKGTYVKSICISSTMSPGVKVDTKAASV